MSSNPGSVPEWFFFDGGPSAPRYGDDPTKHAVDHDTESFVREVLQNANDQGLNNDDPVKVTFRFLSLRGDDRREFLDALQWNDGLGTHVTSVAESTRGRGYDRILERLNDPDSELRLLVVEDSNTTGLTGEWDDDSNYAALVRDELYSSKQDDTAGGSYGLGKSVLWTFSGLSTVVFNSYPADSGDHLAEPPRLVARTKLPTHQIQHDTTTYQGAGWLCHPNTTDDGVRPDAIWGDEAAELAERLRANRPAESGTTAMVVGFRDPTRDARPELEELADEFVEAAVKYFWPALYHDDLRVSVETPEGTREASVDDVPAIRPFVSCYIDRYDVDETLNEPGDIAGLDVPVELPPHAHGSPTPAGPVRLAARLASPADDDTYLNRVALFRGTGMVVKYYDQSRVAFGDRNFHAVLACGEARTDGLSTDSDREIDRFLRFAEPPEHDDWISTENLRENYQRGFRRALEEMFSTTRDGLRHLVAKSNGGTDALSERVLKRFPIHSDDGRRRSIASPSRVFDIESTTRFDGTRWQLSGHVDPTEDEFEGWTAEVSLTGIGEDGSQYDDVPIESITTDHEDVTVTTDDGIARIVAGPGANAVSFEGTSQSIGDGDFQSGRVGETRLEIRAELRTPEGE